LFSKKKEKILIFPGALFPQKKPFNQKGEIIFNFSGFPKKGLFFFFPKKKERVFRGFFFRGFPNFLLLLNFWGGKRGIPQKKTFEFGFFFFLEKTPSFKLTFYFFFQKKKTNPLKKGLPNF